MNSGRSVVTKIGSLPFLRGPICLLKLRQISELSKQHWIFVPWSFSFAVFDPKTKTNFEGETLYRAPISFFVYTEHTKWASSDLSLIWADCDSSRGLCQTPPVRELFKPAEFGSRFFWGARPRSSSEGRIKFHIPFLNGCWFAVLYKLVDCWLIKYSALTKWLSALAALMLVALSCCRFPSSLRFALFCGGEILPTSNCSVEMSTWFFCSMVLQRFCKVICYQAHQQWEFNVYALKKLQQVCANHRRVLKLSRLPDSAVI